MSKLRTLLGIAAVATAAGGTLMLSRAGSFGSRAHLGGDREHVVPHHRRRQHDLRFQLLVRDGQRANAIRHARHRQNTGFLITNYYNDRIRTVCAGNEVDGSLVTDISRTGGTATSYVDLDLTLYEGDSCHSSDNDGVGQRGFFIAAGQTVSGSFRVTNYREGTNDRIIVYYTVKSQLV
jgi:hypothetical protein